MARFVSYLYSKTSHARQLKQNKKSIFAVDTAYLGLEHGLPGGAELILLLDNVAGDGRSTVVFGRLPLEVHPVHAPVVDLRH